jgi:hypothetical protein
VRMYFDVCFAYFQGDSLQDALENSFEHTRGHISSLCFLMAEESCSEQGILLKICEVKIIKLHFYSDFSGLKKLLSPLCRGLVIPGDGIVGTNVDGSISAVIFLYSALIS